MSKIYNNWERLVAATLNREQIWQLFHNSSSSSSRSSDNLPSDSSDKHNSVAGACSQVQYSQTCSPVEIIVDCVGSGTSTLLSSHTRTVDFGISPEELVSISREHDISLLQQNGGAKGLSEKLKSNLEKGVPGDENDLISRKTTFGSNTYPQKEQRSLWRFVWNACRRTTMITLMLVAASSLALSIKIEGITEGWYGGGSIALAVFLLITFTAISGYSEYHQFQSLKEKEKQNIKAEVIRSGRRIKVSIFEMVVGDIVALKIGDQVPADGLVIFSHSLSIDESNITGESRIVHKDYIRAPFLMSGCNVVDGYGTTLVMSVGLNTEWGLMMASISVDDKEETPLQVRLKAMATFIGNIFFAVAVLALLVLVARTLSGITKNPDGSVQFIAGRTKVGNAINGFLKTFADGAIILVVVVLEGLPLAITLTLAYIMRKMMADNVLVRSLSACETLGSTTTICCNDTGILNMNQMTVVEAYACGQKIDPHDNKSLLPPSVISLLIEGIAHNTTGSVFVPGDGGAVEVSGSPTEKAILQWGVNLGMNFHAVRSESVIILASPFNSEKKQGGVAVKLSDSKVHGHWKGDAEVVLASSTHYIDMNDSVVPMDEEKISFFEKAIAVMASGSLSCHAIAYRPYEIDEIPSSDEELENWKLPETDLILLAVVGIKVPCQPGVKDPLQLCTNAGIKVCMVSGDNIRTARAIALECGILGSNGDVTESNVTYGRTFRNLSDMKRIIVADRISVIARSTALDKLLLVETLRMKGHVVAVTGDDINDAPALHEADIGISMGIRGSELAKQSSDIIVLDDNFVSVVKAVRWGRSIYGNIQKFIQFQLTINIGSLIINGVVAVSSGVIPLNAEQLLCINLIMGTLGALALATECPTNHIMHRPPVGKRKMVQEWHALKFINLSNLTSLGGSYSSLVLYQVTVLLVLHFCGRRLLNQVHDNTFEATNTLIFNAFVFCQVFNMFNTRNLYGINVWEGITKSHAFMGMIVLEVVFQVIIICFLGKFTSTVRLSFNLWMVSIAIGFISWPLAAVGKLIPVPERPFGEYLRRRVVV